MDPNVPRGNRDQESYFKKELQERKRDIEEGLEIAFLHNRNNKKFWGSWDCLAYPPRSKASKTPRTA